MSRTQRIKGGTGRGWYILDLMGICLVAAPLALGAVHIESLLVLAGLVGLLFASTWLDPRRPLPRLPLVGWVALGWLIWSLLLLTPLPSGVVAALSRDAHTTYAEMSAILGVTLSPSLALDRPRGASMVVLLLVYAFVAMTVWARTLQSKGSARSPIPFYVVFAGGMASVVCVLHTLLDATSLYGIYAPSVSLEREPIRGPMVNPNHTAALLLLTMTVTFGYWLQAKARSRAFLLALNWALMGVLIVLSGSRANLALLIAVHAYLLWFIRQGSSPLRATRVKWTLASLVTLGGGVFIYALVTSAQHIADSSGSVWGELVIRWITGAHVLLDSPWLGHGPGNFPIAATLHTSDWLTGYLSRAHNLPLQLMTEWGAPVGLALFGLLVWWLGVLLVKTQSTPSRHAVAVGLSALVVQNMVDFSLLIPGIGIVWVACAAWLSARTTQRRTRLEPWVWQHGALSAACLGMLASLSVVAYQGDARNADAALRAATTPEEASGVVQRVLSEHPADFHLHVLASATSLRDGDAELAHKLGQRAQTLAPGAPTALRAAAKAAFAQGDQGAGQESLSRLCHDSPYWRSQCVSMLLEHRDKGALVADILREDVSLTLALVDRLRQRGHRDATTKVLTWARGEFPEALDVHEELVESWLRMPEASDALDALSVDLLAKSAEEEDVARRNRLQRLAYLVQGRLVERERRYLEARHLYEEAASLEPERSVEPLLHAARVLLRLKDYARLEKVLKRLRAALKPHDTVARISYFRLHSSYLVRVGRFKAAARSLHNAIRINPRDPSLYDALAEILEKLGDQRGVERARQRAAELR